MPRDYVAEALSGGISSGLAEHGAGSNLVIKRMSDVPMKPIDWLWKNRIAKGKVTVLAGEGGLGKTTVLLDIAARTSRGNAWPDGEGRAPVGSTIILSSEDDPSDTIKPRLAAACAEMDNVHFIPMVRNDDGSGRQFSLQTDLGALEKEIKRIGDVQLVIIDPITAYLGKVDSHKNAEVRGVLGPLGEMAARLNVAVICNTHFSKVTGGTANNKIIGSVAFVNHARMAIIVTEDPEDSTRRFFIPSKTNISRLTQGLAFRLEERFVEGDGHEVLTTLVAWEIRPVSLTANEVIAALGMGNEGKTQKAEAMSLVQEELANGPKPAADVLTAGRKAGLSPKSLRSAREALGIKPEKDGMSGGWLWSFPKMPSPREGAHQNERASSPPEGIFGDSVPPYRRLCGHCRKDGGRTLECSYGGLAIPYLHRDCIEPWIAQQQQSGGNGGVG
jgi:hypothetical protein